MTLFGMEQWENLLFQGILMFFSLCFSAVILGRAGRSPYWAFLLIIPYVQIVALWMFAFCIWPKTAKRK
jgi:uncharacterized membrane protein YhaH (DUF805 family)